MTRLSYEIDTILSEFGEFSGMGGKRAQLRAERD
ncbi:MAG: hypothetical protein ACI8X5_002632 [Planctomycetota bacterium]|jgi:hypothetical protein